MTREQALNYLYSSGFSKEQVQTIVKALEREPTTKNNLGVDAVSREKAIKWAEFYTDIYGAETANESIMEMLRDLPSVTPQELKTGHWILHPNNIYTHLVCNKCLSVAPYDCKTNFCPNCGADMREVEDGKV